VEDCDGIGVEFEVIDPQLVGFDATYCHWINPFVVIPYVVEKYY